MNRRTTILILTASLLAVLLLFGFSAGGAERTGHASAGGVFAADTAPGDAAAEPEAGETTAVMPTYIFDFTDDDTFSLGFAGHCDVEETDDGLLCTATEDDPNLSIGVPSENGTDMGYMVIKFRGGIHYTSRQGELYFSTADKSFGEQTKVQWIWKDLSEDWNTQVIRARVLGKTDDTILDMRFDPLASGGGGKLVEEGEWLEVAYIAFFKTEEDAKAFDYSAYLEALAAQQSSHHNNNSETWQQPPKAAAGTVLKADNVPGTLKIEHLSSGARDGTSAAGGTVRISYQAGWRQFAYELPDNAFILNGALAGTDDLGRTQPDPFTVIDPDYVGRDGDTPVAVDSEPRTVGVYGENGRRCVGIFYFIWHGTMFDTNDTPRNISALLEQYGTAAKDMPELWAELNKTFFFAEPLYGYYRSDDDWVIRKHMELLTNAGIDFLYFDVTNNYLYETNILHVMSILHELNEAGYPAPKIVCYTNTNAKERVRQAYRHIYEPGNYPDTWFMLDGKPLIIAPSAANIDDFFTIREPQWPNEDHHENTWPWIDFQWPQETYGVGDAEAISVSVAQHSGNAEFSTSGLYGYTGNRGRSYDGYVDAPTADSYKQGTNLQLQFNRAITSGVPYVLVTGWNEWIASRLQAGNKKYPIRFVDTFNYEYSRDIEMSRGGYFDNYYMQLAANTAAVRGAAPVILRDDRHRIDVTGAFAQWDQVAHAYTDPSGDAAWRKNLGYGGVVYKNETGRNDIVRVKVTGDATNLYFMIECAENIVHWDGGDSWLRIFLNTDLAATGWCGYDYILNYSPENDYTTTLAAYSGTGGAYGFTPTGLKLTYRVEGKKLMLGVPMEALGIEYYDRIALSFKVVDSRSDVTTAEQLYEDGDCAPLGRLDYSYRTFLEAEGVDNGTPTSIVKEADRDQYALTEPDVTPRPSTPPKDGKRGFAAALPWIIGGVVVVGLAAAAVLLAVRKKRKN